MRKIMFLLVSLLLVFSCTENKQSTNLKESIDTLENIRSIVVDDNTVENQKENKLFNKEFMKANLTKEEEHIVRTIEKKNNECWIKVVNQEPVEEDLDVFTQNMNDFEQYATVLMESFNRALKLYGYKMPEVSTFQKKINEIWKLNEREDEVCSFKNFKSLYIDSDKFNDTYYFEKALHVSTKYRFVMPFCRFLKFEKELELQNVDSFLPGATISDLNSDLIIDKKIIEPEIYKNLFLFNESKAAKTWLIINDLDFFRRIHYYEDREVNEKKLNAYLSSIPNEYDNYKFPISYEYYDFETIWSGDDMMNLLYEKTDSAIVAYEADKHNILDIKAFDLFSMFLFKFQYDKHYNTKKSFLKFVCQFTSMEISLNKKHSLEEKNGIFNIESSSQSYKLLTEEILELAKKENYFNISDFDDVLKVIEWDKEHDPQGSNDHHPFDYTTLLE